MNLSVTRPKVFSYDGWVFALILIVIVFEGAIRKWVSDAYTIPLVALRDAAALSLVYRAWVNHAFSRMKGITLYFLIFSGILSVWALVQLIVNQGSLTVFFIGLRFWLLYLWYALASACLLSRQDLLNIARLIVLMMAAMVPLVVFQYFSPPSHIINSQIDTEIEDIFRAVGDVVRTSGTFSFTLGFTSFLALSTPFVLSKTLFGKPLWPKRFFHVVLLTALLISVAVSGARAAVLFLGLALMVSLILEYVQAVSAENLVAASYKTLFYIFTAVIVGYFFGDAIISSEDRFREAAQIEDFWQRVFSIFLGESDVSERMTFLGYGIGVGTNAGASVLVGSRDFLLAETEPGRNLMEIGVLGYFWILAKICFSVWGISFSLGLAISRQDSLPFLLWLTVTYAILSWPISGQLSVSALGYVLLAMALGVTRYSMNTLPLKGIRSLRSS